MRTLALACLCALSVPALAERFTVEARVEPESVAFGGRFDLVIEVQRAEGDRLSLARAPSSEKVRPAPEPVRREAVREGELVRETLRVAFLALDYEEVETPKLELTAKDGELVVVESRKITIVDPLMDEAGQPELIPDEAARLLWFSSWDRRPFLALLVLALFGVGMGLGLLWARRSPRVVPTPQKPVVPPEPVDVIALRRLEILLASGLLAKGEVASFVERLMDEVLRFYLEGRFHLPAERSTTRELAERLLTVGHPGLDSDRIQRILEAADLVKFARADLAASAAQTMAGHVRALVEETRVQREAA